MIPYACPVCKVLDEAGISGHHNRCKVANKVVDNSATMVANEPSEEKSVGKTKHGVYKDKASRLKYMRELMRKRREAKAKT